MFNRFNPITYINPVLAWLYKHGWEGPQWGPHPEPWATATAGPDPVPWRAGVTQLVEAAKAREVAARLPEGQQRNALLKSAAAAIDSVMDDFCGTVTHRPPWPWPGPPPWVWMIVSELSTAANGMAAGPLRDELGAIAGLVIARANEIAR